MSHNYEPDRPYTYALKLYEVSYRYSYQDIVDNIIWLHQTKRYIENYAFIRHTKDTLANGEKVEPHVHFAIKLKEGMRKDDFYKNILLGKDIPEQDVVGSSSQKNTFAYLIHKFNPDKYQYSVDEVVTPDLNWYKNRILRNTGKWEQDFTYDDILYEIICYIHDYEGQLNLYDLLIWCRRRGDDFYHCFLKTNCNIAINKILQEENFRKINKL